MGIMMGSVVKPDKNLEQENEQVVGLEVVTDGLSYQHGRPNDVGAGQMTAVGAGVVGEGSDQGADGTDLVQGAFPAGGRSLIY
jgi:hypothetical protein